MLYQGDRLLYISYARILLKFDFLSFPLFLLIDRRKVDPGDDAVFDFVLDFFESIEILNAL
jgi:hypothetical protein